MRDGPLALKPHESGTNHEGNDSRVCAVNLTWKVLSVTASDHTSLSRQSHAHITSVEDYYACMFLDVLGVQLFIWSSTVHQLEDYYACMFLEYNAFHGHWRHCHAKQGCMSEGSIIFASPIPL